MSVQAEYRRRKTDALGTVEQDTDVPADGQLPRHEISSEDHPLSLGKASAWHKYFEVNVLSILRSHLNASCYSQADFLSQ